MADRRQNRRSPAAAAVNTPAGPLWRCSETDECASSQTDIAALKLRFHRISYASGVFFTLALHPRPLTNVALPRFHLVRAPTLQRRPPQRPRFLDNPLFGRVRLLEIALRI